MDDPLHVEPRKIEFTTYGPAKAPVWSVTFALHASRGYEHQCTIIVPGHGHDDVADVCAKARIELRRIGNLLADGDLPRPVVPDPATPPVNPSGLGRRSRQRTS